MNLRYRGRHHRPVPFTGRHGSTSSLLLTPSSRTCRHRPYPTGAMAGDEASDARIACEIRFLQGLTNVFAMRVPVHRPWLRCAIGSCLKPLSGTAASVRPGTSPAIPSGRRVEVSCSPGGEHREIVVNTSIDSVCSWASVEAECDRFRGLQAGQPIATWRRSPGWHRRCGPGGTLRVLRGSGSRERSTDDHCCHTLEDPAGHG